MTRVKLNALTGLRIVAAGMIVAHHSRGWFQIPLPNYALHNGVSFFFVLSGFIIAYAYPKLDRKREVFEFLLARVSRIWPAHFAVLLLVVVLLQVPLDRTFTANALLLHSWVPSQPWYFSYNPPSWSISTEFFFYIAFPFLIFQWNRSWWYKWLASAFLVVLLIWVGEAAQLPNETAKDEFTMHGLLYASPAGRLFEFTTGVITCSVFQQLKNVSCKLNDVVFTWLEVLISFIAGYSIANYATFTFLAAYFRDSGTQQWLVSGSDIIIFPFLILVFAFGRGRLSRLFASRPMVLLGEISFSIYLVHVPVFSFYWRYWHIGANPDYLGLAACVAATLVIAFAIWNIVEIPSRSAVKAWSANRYATAPPFATLFSSSPFLGSRWIMKMLRAPAVASGGARPTAENQ